MWIIKTRKCWTKSHGQPHLANEMANYQPGLKRLSEWCRCYAGTVGKAARLAPERGSTLGLGTTAQKWPWPLKHLALLAVLSQESTGISACLRWAEWLLWERNPNVLEAWAEGIRWRSRVFQKLRRYEAVASLLPRFWRYKILWLKQPTHWPSQTKTGAGRLFAWKLFRLRGD